MLTALAAACGPANRMEQESAASAMAPNTLTAEERAAGWRLLFDGRTTAGWRARGRTDMPAGWQVVDGALTRVAPAGDIVTVDEFGDFELALEWKISPGGNSGIFFRVVDEPEREVYESGPEMQVLDNAGHRDGLDPRTSAGSNYGIYAPVRDATRPVGEWNAVRIVVHGSHVEHWLNGVKLVEYELGSHDWWARVRASKFNQMPGYGQARRGRIALQDHGDWVAYRNIKIRPLGGAEKPAG
ncbi:MAG: DUF1080 domain-containing protein [Gemmatimonadetes bacterium]|nr:DUF1080 domain-containing protein [Gemmatimonadota bacterium]